VKVIRPTSIWRVRPFRRIWAASPDRAGIPSVLRKSPPVPLGSIPNSASFPEVRIPLATSEMVPSPPQAMISFVPLRAAEAASSIPCPDRSVKTQVNEPKCVRRSLAIPGHASRVAPAADSGLMITRGIGVSVSDPLGGCQWFFGRRLFGFCFSGLRLVNL